MSKAQQSHLPLEQANLAYPSRSGLARLGMRVEQPRRIALRARGDDDSAKVNALAHKPCTATDGIYPI